MRRPSSSGGSPRERQRDDARAQPAGLEPAPREARGRSRGRAAQQDRVCFRPAASRRPAATETTCRLNFSSESVEPGRDADQLREVQDRHLEVLAGRRLELRLPGVEREVAERARRHHRVGAGLDRLLDRLDQLAERRLLARLDDREAAALDLGRVVDRLAAAGLDDRARATTAGRGPRSRAASTGAGSGSRRTAPRLQALQPLVRRLPAGSS